jgi:hypothetical protein
MRKARMATGVVVVLLLGAALCARWLVEDEPKKSDVILVLAGEADKRPARGLELLDQGYGRKLILDVSTRERVFLWTTPELAEKYVATLAQRSAISICPIRGLSTRDEAREAALCLQAVGGHDMLLVTSDYHTRRALSVFRREIPEDHFAVAAAYDSQEFGVNWWQHREWAKTNLYEWLRLVWWETVDRWR